MASEGFASEVAGAQNRTEGDDCLCLKSEAASSFTALPFKGSSLFTIDRLGSIGARLSVWSLQAVVGLTKSKASKLNTLFLNRENAARQ